jgi:hypothetical protein
LPYTPGSASRLPSTAPWRSVGSGVHTVSREPRRHLMPRGRHGRGAAKRSWVRRDPQKRQQGRPR